MLYASYISLKLENRKKNKQCFSRELIHKNRCLFVFIIMANFRQKPSLIQTDTSHWVSGSVVVFKITPNVNSLGLCSASSRCDSSMKSIWAFQWTLKRVAMVSKDYMSRATTCQSPSQWHSMASLGSPIAKKPCSGAGVRVMKLSVSASSDLLSRLMSSPNWRESSRQDLLTLGKEHVASSQMSGTLPWHCLKLFSR